MNWWIIIGAILGLLAMVVLIIVFMRSYGSVDLVMSPTEAKAKDTVCYLNSRLPRPCSPTDVDKDGDCLPDECDFCISPNAKTPAKTEQEQQAFGSDLFDKDLDGMPDACDIQPGNPAVSKCEKEASGRCKIATRHYQSDGKTQIQLASLGTAKRALDDLLIA